MNLIFVRHGQTDWNLEGRIQGSVDNPLNENGINQAKELAMFLKDRKIDLIISSPLIRAQQTANIINEGREIPIVIDNGVIERNFGELEGKIVDETVTKMRYYTEKYPMPGGENIDEFAARIFAFIDSIKSKYIGYETVLIACHGVVMRAAYWYFTGLPTKPEKEVIFNNGEIYEHTI